MDITLCFADDRRVTAQAEFTPLTYTIRSMPTSGTVVEIITPPHGSVVVSNKPDARVGDKLQIVLLADDYADGDELDWEIAVDIVEGVLTDVVK